MSQPQKWPSEFAPQEPELHQSPYVAQDPVPGSQKAQYTGESWHTQSIVQGTLQGEQAWQSAHGGAPESQQHDQQDSLDATQRQQLPYQEFQQSASQYHAENEHVWVDEQWQDPQSNWSAMVPAELLRIPSGGSVVEPDSVLNDNGRLYHGYKEGKYLFPNDAAEQDRLDVQHAAVTVALDGKLSLVPFTKAPTRVMDVATGTGIWAMEFAEQNPASHVVGTDLSLIQPDRQQSNSEFIKEDAEEKWLYTHKFDYIHLRMVVTCFNDPALVLQHALENLNPGGWIEYQDLCMDLHSPDGSHKVTVRHAACELMKDALRSNGRNPDIPLLYKDMMYEAGLIDVCERTFDLPHGGWSLDPKLQRVGRFMLLNLYDGTRGLLWKMLAGLGWAPDRIEKFVEDARKEFLDPNVRTYAKLYVVYGRRPYEGELDKKQRA